MEITQPTDREAVALLDRIPQQPVTLTRWRAALLVTLALAATVALAYFTFVYVQHAGHTIQDDGRALLATAIFGGGMFASWLVAMVLVGFDRESDA